MWKQFHFETAHDAALMLYATAAIQEQKPFALEVAAGVCVCGSGGGGSGRRVWPVEGAWVGGGVGGGRATACMPAFKSLPMSRLNIDTD